jgi:hypothetical protein
MGYRLETLVTAQGPVTEQLAADAAQQTFGTMASRSTPALRTHRLERRCSAEFPVSSEPYAPRGDLLPTRNGAQVFSVGDLNFGGQMLL